MDGIDSLPARDVLFARHRIGHVARRLIARHARDVARAVGDERGDRHLHRKLRAREAAYERFVIRQGGLALHAQTGRAVEGHEQHADGRGGGHVAHRVIHAVAVVVGEEQGAPIQDVHKPRRPAFEADGG